MKATNKSYGDFSSSVHHGRTPPSHKSGRLSRDSFPAFHELEAVWCNWLCCWFHRYFSSILADYGHNTSMTFKQHHYWVLHRPS